MTYLGRTLLCISTIGEADTLCGYFVLARSAGDITRTLSVRSIYMCTGGVETGCGVLSIRFRSHNSQFGGVRARYSYPS